MNNASRRVTVRALIGAVVLAASVASAGSALALRGWRARMPDTDVLAGMQNSHALLEHGRIPDRGVVSSYGSYTPPGVAWMVLPDAAFVSDLRLFGYLGSWLFQCGTLIGIFLLTRTFFGARCGFLSVLLYGFSASGLYFAKGLWLEPRSHPFFFVWMAYFACEWVRRRDSRYLAASLVTWAAGMYVFMEMAPALFIIPAMWVVYRPPIKLRALVVSGLLSCVIWYPYLRFEATRRFADVRSQVLLEHLWPANWRSSLCDPTLPVRTLGHPAGGLRPMSGGSQPSSLALALAAAGRRALAVTRGVLANYSTVAPATDIVLFGLTVATLAFLAQARIRAVRVWLGGVGLMPSPWLFTACGIILLALALLASAATVERLFPAGWDLQPDSLESIRLFRVMALLSGVALLARRWIVAGAAGAVARLGSPPAGAGSLALSLVVPWLVLMAVVEPGRVERFLFLWPLQVVMLSALAIVVVPRLWSGQRVRFAGSWLFAASVVGVTAWPALALPPLGGGWSGRDSSEAELVAFLAQRVRATGTNHASIGYLVDFAPLPIFATGAAFHRFGAEFDAWLRYRYGVINSDECAEGFTAKDDFLVVAPLDPPDAGLWWRFDVQVDSSFRLLREVGAYRVYARR
jgi:hypothetical protein